MNASKPFTEFHPRWFRQRPSTYWWLWKWAYLRFVLRELSSLAVAWCVVLTLLQARALAAGAAPYADLQDWLRTPWVALLNAVCLSFLMFHSITWFQLAPRAMVVRLGGWRVPDALIIAGNFAAWFAASAAVAWLALGAGR